MSKLRFSSEAKPVFEYIKLALAREYGLSQIPIEAFVVSVIYTDSCEAYNILSKVIKDSDMQELLSWSIGVCQRYPQPETPKKPAFNKSYDTCSEWYEAHVGGPIKTGWFLYSVMVNNTSVCEKMMSLGIYPDRLESLLHDIKASGDKKKRKRKEKQGNAEEEKAGPTETLLTNINNLSLYGLDFTVYMHDKLIDRAFDILGKGIRNNVLLVGEHGSGKTATIRYMADKIVKAEVPFPSRNLIFYDLDFFSIMRQSLIRGDFETKFFSILEDCVKNGSYVLVIDDVHNVLSDNVRFCDEPTPLLIKKILNNSNIPCIMTTTPEAYAKSVKNNDSIAPYVTVLDMPQKNHDDYVEIIEHLKEGLSDLHKVDIPSQVVEDAVRYMEREHPDNVIQGVIDYLDEMCVECGRKAGRFDATTAMDDRLIDIETQISEMQENPDERVYDDYDNLIRTKISLQNDLKESYQNLYTSDIITTATPDDFVDFVKNNTKNNNGLTERMDIKNISNLKDKLLESIVGQDDAVDTIVRSVKRQFIGLSNPNKPYTALLVGSTGCGKTYLAKKLAEAVYGSENKMVRLDMSEFADKTSVNKLYGSSSGYVGYEEGGILTEAIKRNGRCIILLDEIEKADVGVFDAFLQVFDEGNMTDNHGVTVKFGGSIILMTSNLGTQEIINNENRMGFTKSTSNSQNNAIILKAIKKQLRPEFINRIDDIVCFNKLTKDNLREIIKKEIKVVENRAERIGYFFDKSIYSDEIIDDILADCENEGDYGARPILRSVQRNIIDPMTEWLLRNQDSGITVLTSTMLTQKSHD